MSSARSGRAHIDLSIRDRTRRGLVRAQRNLTEFAARTARIGAGLLAVGGGITAGFAAPLRQFAKTEQLLGRFSSIFGGLEGQAAKFADNLASGINQSGLEIRDQLARFQAFLKGSGFKAEDAFDLSKGLTKATQDLVAFDDSLANSEEALRIFLSGMAGETEAVLRSFGANVKVAAVDQELLRLGIAKSSKEATEAQRQLARYNIIMRSLGQAGATGQAAREVDTLASQFRGLSAVFREVQSAIGEALAPIGTFIGLGIKSAASFRTFVSENRSLVQGIALAGVALAGFGGTLVAIGGTVGILAASLGALASPITAVVGLLGPTASVLGAVGLAAAVVATRFDGVRVAIEDTLGQLVPTLSAIKDTLGTTIKGIADALSGKQIELAARIGLKGLELAWAQALANVRSRYNEFQRDLASLLISTAVASPQTFAAITGEKVSLDPEENRRRAEEILPVLNEDFDLRQENIKEEVEKLKKELIAATTEASEAAEVVAAERKARQASQSIPNLVVEAQKGLEKAALQARGTFSGATAGQELGRGPDRVQRLVQEARDGNTIARKVLKELQSRPVLRFG